MKSQDLSLSDLRRAYSKASNRSTELLKEIKYLDSMIGKYSKAIHPLLKGIAIPSSTSETQFVSTFNNVLKAAQKKDSNA